MVHHISPAPLTFEVLDRILNKNYKLALSEESTKRINDCKAYLDHKIETAGKPLYGITTGFGSLCKKCSFHECSNFLDLVNLNHRRDSMNSV